MTSSATSSVASPVVALCTDGTQVTIRPLEDGDHEGLQALLDRLSERSLYLRFFSGSRENASTYYRSLPAADPHRVNLVAVLNDVLVGIAGYELLEEGTAEIAVLVDEDWQGDGIGTLLVEHLLSVARANGVRTAVAEVLEQNSGMLAVLRDLGYVGTTETSAGQRRQVFDLAASQFEARALEAVERRAAVADVASLLPLLCPRSVAVVGASDRPRSVGSGLMRSLTVAGFTGEIFPVNARHKSVAGLTCYPTVREVPAAVDLAVVAVPASRVLGVLHDCGAAGVRHVVLVTAGFRETGAPELEAEVLAVAREHGIRMIGPNCLGVINTDPRVRLSATFAPLAVQPGSLGLASQSGALGIAVLHEVCHRGLGISQFVSLGNKADVSGNDMLRWWEDDPGTRVIGLYLESIKDPRRFARIARRVSRDRPILLLKSGRTRAGQRAGLSHTAAAATSDVLVDALCAQSGIVRVATVQELVNAAIVLSSQPLPSGPRVVIVGNSGGPEILATDAAVTAGLTVSALSASLTARLRALVPGAASLGNPVDLGGDADAAAVIAVLRELAGSDEADAVMIVAAPTVALDTAELREQLRAVRTDRPVLLADLGAETTDTGFAYPEDAAVALGHAWKYVQLREPASGPEPQVDVDDETVTAVLAGAPDGLLAEESTSRILAAYRLPVVGQVVVHDVPGAIRAAEALGYPVVVKATGIAHRTECGGVHLGLSDADSVAQAFDSCRRLGDAVLVQATVPAGSEVIVGAVRDPNFGPLVGVGAGGVLADLLGHRAFRMAPLDQPDLDALVAGVPAAVRAGFRGAPPVPEHALVELITRISLLVTRHPTIADLDLNPVIAGPAGLVVVDAKIRIAPPQDRDDPLARHLASQE